MVENKITLNRFEPRWYQLPIFDAIENKGYRNVVAVLPRRAGKDIAAFNLCIRECLRRPQIIFYIFPSYAQAKKAIWDAINDDGMRFLDYIPSGIVSSKNSQEMKIWFTNGSLLQLVGSDNYDRLRGTNPQACVFSEYAYQDPNGYKMMRPILAANKGWALFISTPRGHNHFYKLYHIAQEHENWFHYCLTVDDTKHIDHEEIDRELREGHMSKDMVEQEYYCSFDMGIEGAYYAKYLDDMRQCGQITHVPYDPGNLVHTAWDLGLRDSNAIIFFQVIGKSFHIIDAYSDTNIGLEQYVKALNNRGYVYGKHIAPHDIKMREYTTGVSRYEKARDLGVEFIVAPRLNILDGIEAVRTILPRTYIDMTHAASVVEALENYRKEWDDSRQDYKPYPRHDRYSHLADAVRMMAVSQAYVKGGMSEEDLKDHYYGMYQRPNLPPFFSDPGGTRW